MNFKSYAYCFVATLALLPLVSAADAVKTATWGECEAIEILPSGHRRGVFQRGRNGVEASDAMTAYCDQAHKCIEKKCKTKMAAQEFVAVNPVSLTTAPGEIDEVKASLRDAVVSKASRDPRFDLGTLSFGVYSQYPNDDLLREDLQGYLVRVEVSSK